jgi:ribonucleoside-diphosphate reductase alpha chain
LASLSKRFTTLSCFNRLVLESDSLSIASVLLDSSASGEGRAADPSAVVRICADAFNLIERHGTHSANMAVMRVDHLDVLAFIDAKAVDGVFQHFKLSIALTDIFREKAVSEDLQPCTCEWNCEKMLPRRIM